MLDAGSIQYTVEIETAKTLKAQDQLDGGFNKLQGGMDKTDRAASNLNKGMSKLALSIAAVISASAIRAMADLVQGYQEMAERVKMATSSQEEYEMVQKRLLDTANKTYRSLGEAQEIYLRTQSSLKSLGYTTSEALDVTESLSLAFVKSSTSADRAKIAMGAFSRALAKGRVDSDAWEMMLVAIPDLADQMAASLGKTSQEVRKLGVEGDITTKQLSDGLRAALKENEAAAAGMAVTLKDASVRSTTALTLILNAVENNTGALQNFTQAIVTAADMVIEFAGDSEKMASAMEAAGTAVATLATVIAAKLVGSMSIAGYEMAKSAAQLVQKTMATKAAAAANVELARTEAINAAEALVAARANAQVGLTIWSRAAATTALAAAEARATAATVALSAANRVMAATATVATVAVNGLKTAMMFLGGPVGIALLAATAIWQFGFSAKEAKPETDKLTGSINTLSTAAERAEQRFASLTTGLDKLNKAQLSARRGDLEKQLAGAERQLKSFQRQFDKGVGSLGQIEGAKASITELKKALEGLDSRAGTDGGGGDAGTEAGQKRIKAMQDELALLKVTGEKRAELAALQRLGDEATGKEKERVKELAIEIYNLEEAQRATKGSREKLTDAQKEAAKAAEDEKRGIEQNADVLADLNEAIKQATMSTEALIQRKAELRLNKYAAPEEIAEVQRLALELDNLEKIKARKEKITGADGGVEGYVDGNVDPLSGGQFDDQTARYEAEAKKEQERYAAQHARLLEAKELELITEADYQLRLEEQFQTHSDRMAQIEQAKNQLLIDSGQQMFDGMADALKVFAGEQSNAYKGMFAVSKAWAIADATVNAYAAISKAWASAPFPANLGAVAATTPQVMGVVSAISGANFAGRALGGPVQSGQMYRVNENGPEIFNAANGRQYMMPNQRGEVVSNKDATAQMSGGGGNSTSNTMNLTINMQGGNNGNYTATQIANKAAEQQRIQQARFR